MEQVIVMHKYIISDVWMALKMSFLNFLALIFLFWGIVIFLFVQGVSEEPLLDARDFWTTAYTFAVPIAIGIVPIAFIQSIFIYFANRRYVVDMETGEITFPRTDIENTILDILLLRPYWNQMRTKTINAAEIENIYLDTKRWSTKHKVPDGSKADGSTKYHTETKNHVRYNLNVTGIFGSAKFEFLDRQKRDEIRNAIQQCVKQHSNINVDRKVSEFG